MKSVNQCVTECRPCLNSVLKSNPSVSACRTHGIRIKTWLWSYSKCHGEQDNNMQVYIVPLLSFIRIVFEFRTRTNSFPGTEYLDRKDYGTNDVQGIFPSPNWRLVVRRVTLLITASCSEPSLMTAQGCVNRIQVCVIGEKKTQPKKPNKNHHKTPKNPQTINKTHPTQ